MTVVVLFHRDLRVYDHPALAEACRSGHDVVPLFVVDPGVLDRTGASANRAAFLEDSLVDLRRSLRQRGGELFVRHGDPVAETMKVAAAVHATAVFLAGDVSRYARKREERLAHRGAHARVEVVRFPGVNVVAPGELVPAGGDHYRVFTPYWNRWQNATRRRVEAAPRAIPVPAALPAGRLPSLRQLSTRPTSPALVRGGETIGTAQARTWMRRHLSGYADAHDDLAGDRTSRLSPYLHFGCVSPNWLVRDALRHGEAEPFVRQLCWRDFHHQVNAAFPDLPGRDYRPRQGPWRDDPSGLKAWKDGQTGIPIVDAGMRQLRLEGWMHNRARLLVASFLTRDLGVAWQHGAQHFLEWLVDGDIANNSGNWQWVAGTGNDTRPNRRFNVLRQALRHDADGSYVRRYVPDLAGIAGPAVHQPWRLSEALRLGAGYPGPIWDPPTSR